MDLTPGNGTAEIVDGGLIKLYWQDNNTKFCGLYNEITKEFNGTIGRIQADDTQQIVLTMRRKD